MILSAAYPVAPAKKRRVSHKTLDKSRLWRDGAFGAHCQMEAAVDDFAARQFAENDMLNR